MHEFDENLTLEDAVETYGKTRGLAAYMTVKAILHLEEQSSNFESLEDVFYEILTNFIDE